jgi:hypothetical protein
MDKGISYLWSQGSNSIFHESFPEGKHDTPTCFDFDENNTFSIAKPCFLSIHGQRLPLLMETTNLWHVYLQTYWHLD